MNCWRHSHWEFVRAEERNHENDKKFLQKVFERIDEDGAKTIGFRLFGMSLQDATSGYKQPVTAVQSYGMVARVTDPQRH